MTWSISRSGSKNDVIEQVGKTTAYEGMAELEKSSHDRARDYAIAHLAASPEHHDTASVSGSGHSTTTDGVVTATSAQINIQTSKAPEPTPAPSEGG